jgi:hypothetical protein
VEEVTAKEGKDNFSVSGDALTEGVIRPSENLCVGRLECNYILKASEIGLGCTRKNQL